MKNLWILGPGSSLNQYTTWLSNLTGAHVLAYQGVFPHCLKYFSLVPTYWTGQDPNALVEGLEFIRDGGSDLYERLKSMTIVIPHYMAQHYGMFRQFAGTTQIAHTPGKWAYYKDLIEKARALGYKVDIMKVYTTKNIALEEQHSNPYFQDNDIFTPATEYSRFMSPRPIFGTPPYDSESVIGDRYKWGLENKLSSQAFPLAYHWGYKRLYVAGFDLVGSRFYDDNVRHPWDDNLIDQRKLQDIPLGFIRQWKEWATLHGMEIYSVVENEYTLINQVLPYCPIDKAAAEEGITG
jgi:hypothetical protein